MDQRDIVAGQIQDELNKLRKMARDLQRLRAALLIFVALYVCFVIWQISTGTECRG